MVSGPPGLPLPPERHAYRFQLDGERWLDDPANPDKIHEGFGGLSPLVTLV